MFCGREATVLPTHVNLRRGGWLQLHIDGEERPSIMLYRESQVEPLEPENSVVRT